MYNSLSETSRNSFLPPADRLGIAASLVCLVHCAAVPVLALAVPALGAVWLAGEWLGWAGIGTAAVVAAVTLPAGHERHGKLAPLALAAAGILLLVLGEVTGETSLLAGVMLSLVGATGVIAAQLLNRRFYRSCRVCGHARCAAPIRSEETNS